MDSKPSTDGIFNPVEVRQSAITSEIRGQQPVRIMLLFAIFHLLVMIMAAKAAFWDNLSFSLLASDAIMERPGPLTLNAQDASGSVG